VRTADVAAVMLVCSIEEHASAWRVAMAGAVQGHAHWPLWLQDADLAGKAADMHQQLKAVEEREGAARRQEEAAKQLQSELSSRLREVWRCLLKSLPACQQHLLSSHVLVIVACQLCSACLWQTC
jgi:hypothetical protein